MYEPETFISGNGESVLVRDTDSPTGYRVGQFTGNTRPESESFEIGLIDARTGDVERTAFFHKEDLYENTEANSERLKSDAAMR